MAVSSGTFSTFFSSKTALMLPKSASSSFGFISLAVPFPSNSRAVCTVTSATVSEPVKGKPEPKGIMKSRPVSLEMQAIVGVPEIARTQALKHIWAHIKENNLQDPENKKVIICDDKLKKIFAGKDRVGFLEIAGLISPHFL